MFAIFILAESCCEWLYYDRDIRAEWSWIGSIIGAHSPNHSTIGWSDFLLEKNWTPGKLCLMPMLLFSLAHRASKNFDVYNNIRKFFLQTCFKSEPEVYRIIKWRDSKKKFGFLWPGQKLIFFRGPHIF